MFLDNEKFVKAFVGLCRGGETYGSLKTSEGLLPGRGLYSTVGWMGRLKLVETVFNDGRFRVESSRETLYSLKFKTCRSMVVIDDSWIPVLELLDLGAPLIYAYSKNDSSAVGQVLFIDYSCLSFNQIVYGGRPGEMELSMIRVSKGTPVEWSKAFTFNGMDLGMAKGLLHL